MSSATTPSLSLWYLSWLEFLDWNLPTAGSLCLFLGICCCCHWQCHHFMYHQGGEESSRAPCFSSWPCCQLLTCLLWCHCALHAGYLLDECQGNQLMPASHRCFSSHHFMSWSLGSFWLWLLTDLWLSGILWDIQLSLVTTCLWRWHWLSWQGAVAVLHPSTHPGEKTESFQTHVIAYFILCLHGCSANSLRRHLWSHCLWPYGYCSVCGIWSVFYHSVIWALSFMLSFGYPLGRHWGKAFSTCGSHLCVIAFFYSPVIFFCLAQILGYRYGSPPTDYHWQSLLGALPWSTLWFMGSDQANAGVGAKNLPLSRRLMLVPYGAGNHVRL